MTHADVFTEEAMTRPLFEELTGEHAREDEWSGPHGFALGGMMQANAASLAEEYFVAANELVSESRDDSLHGDEDTPMRNQQEEWLPHLRKLLSRAS